MTPHLVQGARERLVRPGRAPLVSVAGAVLLILWMAAPIFGQSASVLDVVPEGVVLDAAPLPDLRPGGRIGFRRPDGSAAQVGEGWVLDVREGRALVGLKPGGGVQAGDIAVSCASLTGPGSQTDLRASVQSLKTQLSSSGGGSAELQTAIAQLESTLDARETAIRDGACEVASHDQQIVASSQQLQQILAASSGTAPLPPSTAPGQETVVAPPPSEGVPSGVGQGTTASESLASALPLLQQIFQLVQSMGLVGGGTPSEGQQPVAPPAPPDPVSDIVDPSPPRIDRGNPPHAPPRPQVIVDRPPSPPPPKVVHLPPPPPPRGERPPGVLGPVGPSQWWTIIPPKEAPPAITGAVPGSPSGSIGGRAPVLKLPPGTTARPGTGPIVGVPPTLQRTAAVQGAVRADNGAAIPGANVVIGGKQVTTNARGLFLVDDVPLGRQILVVTARGFVQGKLAVDLSSGEVERVTLTLRHATPLPLGRVR